MLIKNNELIRAVTNSGLFLLSIKIGWIGRALSAGVDLFENMFLDTGSGGQINTGCSKKWFQRFRRDPSGIHLVIGKQRGGKSALCFFLAHPQAAHLCHHCSR